MKKKLFFGRKITSLFHYLSPEDEPASAVIISKKTGLPFLAA